VSSLRRLILDVLKPLEPTIVDLAQTLASLEGVEGVNISIYEIDRRVENAKVTIEGKDLSLDEIENIIRQNGGAVHSIDGVVAGHRLVEDVLTPQD